MLTRLSGKASLTLTPYLTTALLILLAIQCAVLCVFPPGVGAMNHNLIPAQNVKRASTRTPMSLVSSNPHEIVISLEVPGVSLDTVSVEDTTYHTVEITGWESTSKPGAPKLPFWSELVAVPPSKEIVITVEVVDSLMAMAEGCHVYPSERMVPKISPDRIPYQETIFEFDQSAYLSEEFYPEAIAKISEVFHIRNQKVVRLDVYPIRYNPSQRQLLVYSSLKIRLLPQSVSGPLSTPVGPYDKIVQRLVLAYDTVHSQPIPTLLSGAPLDGSVAWCHSVQECADHQTDYLMMVADRFFQEGDSSSAVFQLADHRASTTGFNVAIVSVENLGLGIQVGPDTLIKVFIDSLYRTQTAEHMSDDRLGYTLLAGAFMGSGGDTLIPVHWENTQFPVGYKDYPSDNWFVAFADTGLPRNSLPHLEIGRLAVIDSEGLSTVVDKIIRSEPLPDAPGWRNKLFLTAGSNLKPKDAPVLEETFSDLTELAYAAGYDTLLFRGDQQVQNYNFTAENCGVINSGVRFVHYGIHGARCQMAAPPSFSIDSLSCFANSDSLPIFFTGACKTASFDTLCISATDTVACIGAALVNLASGGAVAFLGPADAGDLHVDFPACVDIFASWVKYQSPFVGDAWFEAKLALPYSPFARSFTLIGDPAFNVLLRESGVGYCDLGVREGEFLFQPDLDLSPLETVTSIPVRNLTPYLADSDTFRVHFYFKEEYADTTEWVLIDSCFVGPIGPWCVDTASVTWDLRDIPGARYDVKVIADPLGDLVEAYENNNIVMTKVPIGISLEGFPTSLSANPAASPTVAPLLAYGQRKPFVIICTEGGIVNAISAEGGRPAIYETGATPIFSVAIGDLCRDERTLQVVASGDSLRVIDMFSTHPTKWVLPLPDSGIVRTSPSLADLDFNETHDLEIVLGAVNGTSSQVLAIDCSANSGSVSWSRTLGDTSTVGLVVDPILLVNLDGAPGDDIVVSTTHGLLFALDGQTGRVFSSVDIAPGDATPASNPVSSDLDLDGTPEVICGSSILAVYQADTLLTTRASTALTGEHTLYLSTGNIDYLGDPGSEIVLASTSRLATFDYDPSQLPKLQERFSWPTTDSVHTVPAIGDVKWDNGPEIVFASGDSLYVLSALSGEGTLLTRKALNGAVPSSPCLADITADGFPDIIIGAAASLEAIRGRGQTRNVEWEMFGSDIRHRSVRSAVLSGSITADRVLWGRNTIVGDVTIPPQRTLIVEPGAIVEFAPAPGVPRGEMTLTVVGTLVLKGTPEENITFTSGYFSKARGDWDAIELFGPDSLKIEYCNFEYAFQALWTGCVPIIQECTFTNCADCGIYADNDSPHVQSCSFRDNRCDISLLSASAVIESCTFEHQDICGVHCWGDLGSIIKGNRFDASGCHGWAIYIWHLMGVLEISDNWIDGYGSRGILSDGGYEGSCQIHHNVLRFVDGPGMEFNESIYPQEHFGRAYLDSNIVFRCGYGVWSDATDLRDYPVLEASGDTVGNNSIKDNIYKDAKNTCGWLNIPARGNWWGFDCSNPDSIAEHIDGPFDIDPCLSSDPYAGIDSAVASPPLVALQQNVPNPFTTTTRIRFMLAKTSRVKLSIYNVRGQLVKVLIDGTAKEGEHAITWDGTAEPGTRVSPGIYFCVLSTPMGTQTKKLVLLK